MSVVLYSLSICSKVNLLSIFVYVHYAKNTNSQISGKLDINSIM